MLRPARQYSTSTALTASVTICMPIRCLHLMRKPANASGRHFQGVHHDIWDRDFPSPPILFTMNRDGKQIDALAQTTKQGFIYVFDRVNGKPLFPVREAPYPASDVPGEVASLTQPLPLAPEPFGRQILTAEMLTNRTPEAHQFALNQFKDSAQRRAVHSLLPSIS